MSTKITDKNSQMEAWVLLSLAFWGGKAKTAVLQETAVSLSLAADEVGADLRPRQEARHQKPVLKGLAKIVFDTAVEMDPRPEQTYVRLEDLIAAVKRKLPAPSGNRDLRRQRILTTLAIVLIPGDYLFMQGEALVGLTNTKQLDEESTWVL